MTSSPSVESPYECTHDEEDMESTSVEASVKSCLLAAAALRRTAGAPQRLRATTWTWSPSRQWQAAGNTGCSPTAVAGICVSLYNVVLSAASGGKYRGPVTWKGWCAATAGPDPPRPSLPDLHFFSSGFLGPDAGQLGLPNLSFNLATTLDSSMAFDGLSVCGALHGFPALNFEHLEVPSSLTHR